MKKIGIYCVAASLLLFTGCNNEDLFNENGDLYTLNATVENYAPTSRVGFDMNNSGSFFWNSGDAIAVGTASLAKYTTACNDKSTSATFTSLSAATGYAIYPYSGAQSMSGNTLSYKFADNYIYSSVDTDFFNGMSVDIPMWAKVEGNTLSFKHLGGVFAFKFPNLKKGNNQIFTMTANSKISGTFTTDLNVSEGEPEIKTLATDTDSEKKVTINFSLSQDANAVFYVPVPTGTYEIKVEIKNGDDSFSQEWKGLAVSRRSILYTTLSAHSLQGTEAKVVSSASEIKTAMESSTSVVLSEIKSDNENSTVSIELPKKDSNSNLAHSLSFGSIDSNTKTIEIKESTSDTGASISELVVSVPTTEDAKKLVIDMPNTTISIVVNGLNNHLTLEEVTAATAENTLIINKGVTVKTLKVKRGHVRVHGTVSAISREGSDNGDVTYIIQAEDATIPSNLGEEFKVVSAAEYDLIKAVSSATSSTITLDKDVVVKNSLTIAANANLTLDLNGHTLTCEVVDDILFRVNGKLTINGGTSGSAIVAASSYIASVNSGGEVTVNGGSHKASLTCFQANGGIVKVNGGTFEVTTPTGYDTRYLLNHIDGQKNIGKIEVSGGTFNAYNPANSTSENPAMNFVADGYVSYQSDENEWTVVSKDAEIEVSSADNLVSVMTQGGKVKLAADVTLTGSEYPAPAENENYFYFTKASVLDLNGHTLTYIGDDVIFRIGAGGDITINGTTANSKILTNPTTPGTGGNGYVALVKTDGKVTFNGGEYVLKGTCTVAQSSGGQVTVLGGTFDAQKEGSYARGTYTFNCKDEYAEAGLISISGGTFKYFNPARNSAENPKISFVADGYVSYQLGDDEWTVVSKEQTIQVSTATELQSILSQGGNAQLSADITLDSPIFVDKKATLALNNKSITTTGETFYVKDEVSAAICVKENGELTINGEGTVDSHATDDYAVEVRGGILNISNGKFIGACTSAYAVSGTINISGGEFTIGEENNYEYVYVLNLMDANSQNGNAAIKVTGGKFYKFNPADNSSENPKVNYVQEGYTSGAEGDYYVVSTSSN